MARPPSRAAGFSDCVRLRDVLHRSTGSRPPEPLSSDGTLTGTEFDRRLAPVLALGILGILGLVVVCFWVVFQMSGKA
jgi:hypothetical protein